MCQQEDLSKQGRLPRGRAPRCIVLAPTRELAKQVEREFQGCAPSLTVGCYYGGAHLQMAVQMSDGLVIVSSACCSRLCPHVQLLPDKSFYGRYQTAAMFELLIRSISGPLPQASVLQRESHLLLRVTPFSVETSLLN